MSDATDLTQIHLALPGCSHKGVRLRMLSPSECDAVAKEAFGTVGKDGSMLDLHNAEGQIGACRMIVEMTDGHVSEEMLLDSETKWVKPSKAELAESPTSFFSAKEWNILAEGYFRMHRARKDEVDAVFLKAMRVTTK